MYDISEFKRAPCQQQKEAEMSGTGNYEGHGVMDVNEVKRILAHKSLSSINVGGFLIVTNSDFDVTISGEPYLALMLLYNIKSGKFMARIWNQTVATGWATKNYEFDEACQRHFGQGRPCLGILCSQSPKINTSQEYFVTQTPIRRIISKSCCKLLGKYADSNCISCPECLKLENLEATVHGKNEHQNLIKDEEDSGGSVFLKKEELDNDWHQDSTMIHEGESEEIVGTESTTEDAVLHKCDICDKSFKDKYKLRKHILNKHSFECIECGSMWTKKHDLKAHLQTAHNTTLTSDMLKKCKHTTMENPRLPPNQNHQIRWNKLKTVKGPEGEGKACPWCEKVMTSGHVWNDHKEFAHYYGSFKCPACPFRCHFAKDVVEHMINRAHSGDVHCRKCKNDFPLAEIVSHYVMCLTGCVMCNKTFASRCGVRQHKNYVHADGEPSCCEICGKRLKNLDAVKKHVTNFHEKGGYQNLPWFNKPTPCPMCELTFGNYGQMQKHKTKVHFREKNQRQCQKCGVRFLSNHQLQAHMRRHEAPQFKCGFCSKMLVTRKTLEAHERAHKGEKPFPCSMCSAGFTSKNGIAQHMRGAHKVAGPRGGKGGWGNMRKRQAD